MNVCSLYFYGFTAPTSYPSSLYFFLKWVDWTVGNLLQDRKLNIRLFFREGEGMKERRKLRGRGDSTWVLMKRSKAGYIIKFPFC